MSLAEAPSSTATPVETVKNVDLKLEVVVVPVSDVEARRRSTAGSVGGSTPTSPSTTASKWCSSLRPARGHRSKFGTGMTSAPPGSAENLYLIVSDIEAARDEFVARGAEVSEVFHPDAPGAQFQPAGASGQVSGPAPYHGTYRTFATFSDPDGNRWLLQEITTRLPGRVDASETAFASATDLAGALRRAEAAHAEHERRTGQPDADWPQWYATYMVAEQAGAQLPT
jgi:hypothetical protein